MTSVVRFPVAGIFGVGCLATRLKALESVNQIGPWHIGHWIDYTHTTIRRREVYILSHREVDVFSSEAWAQWISLNANNLVWTRICQMDRHDMTEGIGNPEGNADSYFHPLPGYTPSGLGLASR